jgi:RNA polymerase sigma-70 factor (ECF subfamily)
MNRIKTVADSNSNKDVCCRDPEYKELVIRMKNGDSQACDSLFCLYKDKLLRYLCLIKSIEDSEDIVQDVFIKIWNEKEKIDEQKNFKSYIFKIARNLAIDKRRKLSKETHSPIEDIYSSGEDLEKNLLNNEKHQILKEALNLLSPQQKEIYELHHVQKKKLKLKEIAQKMNISVSAVQNAINKSNKKISEYFAKKNYF